MVNRIILMSCIYLETPCIFVSIYLSIYLSVRHNTERIVLYHLFLWMSYLLWPHTHIPATGTIDALLHSLHCARAITLLLNNDCSHAITVYDQLTRAFTALSHLPHLYIHCTYKRTLIVQSMHLYIYYSHTVTAHVHALHTHTLTALL